MKVTVNDNPVETRDGMTALEVLKAAGFSSGHHLALEMPDGKTLMHLEDNEVLKPSAGDKYQAVPVAAKGQKYRRTRLCS